VQDFVIVESNMKPARPWMLAHLKIICVCNKSHLFFNLFNLFWHTDKHFCFYVEVKFWDLVRNDNSNKGTTARLNETRFGPKNKSSPIYLGPKNLDTFWCTGWAWNCQIIFRCASIHGRAGFILDSKQTFLSVCQKRLNKLKNKWLLLHTGSGFQWYRTYERGYETSGSRLRLFFSSLSIVTIFVYVEETNVNKKQLPPFDQRRTTFLQAFVAVVVAFIIYL
jgi:hypothetical protein